VTTFFTIDRANERIPDVHELLLLLRSQREELVRLRDRYVWLTGGILGDDRSDGVGAGDSDRLDPSGSSAPSGPGSSTSSGPTLTERREARLVQLRIKGIVDQMGASVARIDEWGITLRDIQAGLIDFPALVNGRQIWLCWRLGEGDIAWWHELDTGFSGRQRLEELH
jgi:hypothetical protein